MLSGVRWTLVSDLLGAMCDVGLHRQTTILENFPLKLSVFGGVRFWLYWRRAGSKKGGVSWGMFGTLRFPFGGFFRCSPNHLFRRLKLNYGFCRLFSMPKKVLFGQPAFLSFVIQYFALVYFSCYSLLWLTSFAVLVLDLWLLLLSVVFVVVVVIVIALLLLLGCHWSCVVLLLLLL